MPKVGMREIRQEQVIEATKRCIVKKGLSNMSIEDIAEEAEISSGVIYHYFKNKEEVLLKVLKKSFQQSHEHVMKSVEPLFNPKEKLFKHYNDYST